MNDSILIAEHDYSPKAVALYKKMGRIYFWFEMTAAERRRRMAEARVLVVRLALTVDRALIGAMPNLNIIATSTTGLNHIDTEAAAQQGIAVISLRGHADFLQRIPSTAELTMGLMIALLRNIPWAFEDVKKGTWQGTRWSGTQLFGKTLGIVGFGRLGTLVAGYARAFGMRIFAADPHVSQETMRGFGVRKVSLEALLKSADIISLHALLTDATHDLIKRAHFALMKPNAYFINTARAELVERGALLEALEQERIAGAAVDVLYDERENGGHLKKDGLLAYAKTHQNLIIVPHIGGATREARWATQEFLAKQVVKKLEISH